MNKEELIHYVIIVGLFIYLLNPTNLTYKHVHLTSALILSYLILFPNKHPKLIQYLYNLRALLLVYFIIDFNVDPIISLFLLMTYLIIVYQVKYANVSYGYSETFTNMNTEVKKQLNTMDNYKYDNSQYVKDSEYKQDNEEDKCNGNKVISEKQLETISSNAIVDGDGKDLLTYRDGYSAQGTTFMMGYNYDSYGDLTKESNIE